MSTTPNNGIDYVPENTADPAAGLNLALDTIDALLQLAVLGIEASPPSGSTDGDRYIVDTGATGDWSGQDGKIARYVDAGDYWQFYDAFIALNMGDGKIYINNGGWVSVGDAALRSELNSSDNDKGAELIAVNNKSVRDLILQPESGQSNFEKIATLARIGKLRLAVLGDSTAAGGGVLGATAYGECNSDIESGYSLFWAYNLIKSDPNFTAPDNTSSYYRRNSYLDTPPLVSAFPSYSLIFSESPTISPMRVKVNNGSRTTDKLTIYHNIRTASAAATFDVVVKTKTGVLISTQTIDTYAAARNFGIAGEVPVDNRLSKTTITLPAAYREVTVEINNISLLDRGDGVPANGSALCYGFALGDGVDVRNYAVSSTTLENESAANINRGITTTERIQKAYDMNANAVVLNWGTNDSKTGGMSASAFKSELVTRIGQIRTYLPDCAIILATTASGQAGSVYENNVQYFKAIREVAQLEKCGLLDGERILSQCTRSEVVGDEVHPTQFGYYALASCLSSLTGCENLSIADADIPVFSTTKETINGNSFAEDFTGDWVLIADIPIGNVPIDAQILVDVMVNLYRLSANIELFEAVLDYSNSAGGTAPSPTTQGTSWRASFSRIPSESGPAWGVVSFRDVLEHANKFTLGPYYLKLYMKNFSLRPVPEAIQINWKYEAV